MPGLLENILSLFKLLCKCRMIGLGSAWGWWLIKTFDILEPHAVEIVETSGSYVFW